eukprot:7257489-Karenia_brevis.AAC.1
MSMFGNELAFYRKEHTLSTSYDMENFYDNISIPIFIQEANSLGYPTPHPRTGTAYAHGMQKPQGALKAVPLQKILLHAIIHEAYVIIRRMGHWPEGCPYSMPPPCALL